MYRETIARAFSSVTAAFGRACCVVISCEIRRSDVIHHVGCDVLRTCSMENQTVARSGFLSGSVGETNCSQGKQTVTRQRAEESRSRILCLSRLCSGLIY